MLFQNMFGFWNALKIESRGTDTVYSYIVTGYFAINLVISWANYFGLKSGVAVPVYSYVKRLIPPEVD